MCVYLNLIDLINVIFLFIYYLSLYTVVSYHFIVLGTIEIGHTWRYIVFYMFVIHTFIALEDEELNCKI